MILNIKPLSINVAFKGRKFRTKDYDNFIKTMLMILPNSLKIDSKAHLKLFVTFGYSSRASDIDNALKPFIDCLVKKYGFDDRNIYELDVRKEIVKKGDEFIFFKIFEL
jgi:Holliday junction resolvase RusA-like endonuclease